jgi:3-oxoacyl-[acyl-carrier-protein] synthase III
MDGFKVFSFVATEVSKFLKDFLSDGPSPDFFAPHQAQPYMVRQLADGLGLKDALLTIPEETKNPGSCSVPMSLALNADKIAGSRVLVAGFGAGYSASAGIVRISGAFEGRVS